MDFAARLASLNQSANAAAKRRGRSPSDRQHNDRRQRPRHNQTDDPYANMRRMGFRVDPVVPVVAPEDDDQEKRKPHICLLAITIDELVYEHLWKEWIATGDAHVSLVCHAKYPDRVQSAWLQQRLILEPPRIGRGNQLAHPVPRTHRPEWGSVEILRAMLDIVHNGLLIGTTKDEKEEEDSTKKEVKDQRFDPNRYLVRRVEDGPDEVIPPVDKFIFISETCIPIRTLKECCDELCTDMNQSWVNARCRQTPGTPRNKYELDQFARIRIVPSCFRWKADQWMVLSRRHAIAIRQLDNHLPENERMWKRGFSFISASDEMYFPTVMGILQILQQDAETDEGEEKDSRKTEQEVKSNDSNTVTENIQVQIRPVTFTDWSEGMKNPATHTAKNLPRIVKLAKTQGALFARKFAEPISIEQWKAAISSNLDE